MKNTLLSLLLSFLLIFIFCGCADTEKKKENTDSVSSYSYGINIYAYAEKGEIPEISYALGADIENLKTTFKDTLEKGSEIEDLTITEGETTVWLDGGSVMFCYEKAKADKGISVIVAKEYAYNFSMGGVYSKDDIISAMGDTEYTLATGNDVQAFFLPVIPENCESLNYQTGTNKLSFIFTDNYLSAVMLINPENWN